MNERDRLRLEAAAISGGEVSWSYLLPLKVLGRVCVTLTSAGVTYHKLVVGQVARLSGSGKITARGARCIGNLASFAEVPPLNLRGEIE